VLFDLARTDPDALALDDGTRRRTRAELADRVTRTGRHLLDACRVPPGGHVATVLANRAEAVEVILAGTVAGLWVTAVNRHLTAEEVAFVLADSGASVVVCDPEHESVVRAAATGGHGGGPEVAVVGEDWEAALAAAGDEPFDLDGPAGGTMLYTSGTTGRPKGVKRSRPARLGAALAAQSTYGQTLGLDGRGPHLVTGPLYHAAPLGFALMDLHLGAAMVVEERFDAVRTLELIDAHEVRATHLVPTMFVRLLRLPEAVREAFDGSSLRTVLHGAAPIAPSTKRSMIDWWGPVLVEYWGASEGGVVTLVGSEDWLAHPGTVGRAIGSYEVVAVDAEGQPVPAGETGRLWCRTGRQGTAFEYHGDEAKTSAAHPAPGTYTIGDIGRVDDEGWVFLSDREANTIISGGVNIYPAEIEAVLIGHPAVADVGVLGVPDDEWGESVLAVVQLRDGWTAGDELEASLLAHAREHLAGFKVPRRFDVVDELPRLPTGKLLTRVLRERYADDPDRGIGAA
jgi:long-chain acyl-CoA synthetase